MTTAKWAMVAMGCAALMGATAQILFKKANPQFDMTIIRNWWLIGGLTLYGIAFLINILAYRYGEASILYPMVALSYLFVVIMAAMFLGEKFTWLKIAGAMTIIAGVTMIAI